MKIRVKEHEWSCLGDLSDLQPDLTNDNGIPYHCAMTGYKFLFDGTKILAVKKNHLKEESLKGFTYLIKKSLALI